MYEFFQSPIEEELSPFLTKVISSSRELDDFILSPIQFLALAAPP